MLFFFSDFTFDYILILYGLNLLLLHFSSVSIYLVLCVFPLLYYPVENTQEIYDTILALNIFLISWKR